MAEDLPKPLAQARARIEAGRAKAEIWLNKQAKKGRTTKAFDETCWDTSSMSASRMPPRFLTRALS